jgi:hypothetical protein
VAKGRLRRTVPDHRTSKAATKVRREAAAVVPKLTSTHAGRRASNIAATLPQPQMTNARVIIKSVIIERPPPVSS